MVYSRGVLAKEVCALKFIGLLFVFLDGLNFSCLIFKIFIPQSWGRLALTSLLVKRQAPK